VSAAAFENEEQNLFRRFALWAGLAMLFVRLSVLPEISFALLHVNTYILYIVGPPALLGAILTGAVGRTLRHRAGKIWLAFFCWMAIGLPFSSWVGGSVGEFKLYAEFSLPLLFIAGGMAVNWTEVRSLLTVMGVSGVVVIGFARFLAHEDNGRIEMTAGSGTIGNSNDLASHLILLLPFLFYILMDKRRVAAMRYAMILPAGYAFWVILGTASRGALIALAVSFLFVLWRASGKQRVAAVAVALALIGAAAVFLHGNEAERLESLFGAKHEEALESQESRSYLLKQSISYTLEHPIVGVGLGQFSNYEGKSSLEEGKSGNWHETHNAFTEVSSECGIPALVLFVLGIGSAMLSVNRVYGRARREGYPEIANACFCYLLSMVGFMVSITFLSNAFRFYLPAMIGVAIALNAAAERAMSAGTPSPSPPKEAPWAPPIPHRSRILHS
jgi:O-antigen ligase